jgi:hypothetical protein
MDRPMVLKTSPVRDVNSGIRWQRIDLGDDQWFSLYEDGSFHAHGLGPAVDPHRLERP